MYKDNESECESMKDECECMKDEYDCMTENEHKYLNDNEHECIETLSKL